MPRGRTRADKRIAARTETLAHLFDVPRTRIDKAIAEGRIVPSEAVFGVKLFHVETVERAIFGAPSDMTKVPAAGDEFDDDKVSARIAKFAEERRRKKEEQQRRRRETPAQREARKRAEETSEQRAARHRSEELARQRADRKRAAAERSERFQAAKRHRQTASDG